MADAWPLIPASPTPPSHRAACDGRSPDVFRSVFYLPPPRALNWMVADAWAGPTLVLQGVLDPLNDAGGGAMLTAGALHTHRQCVCV